MCGILGVVSAGSKVFTGDMLDSIAHRGPDNQNFYDEFNLYLGHTRLSIQDLSDYGNQPMFSADGRYVIVFNGEIYNHMEIRNVYLKDVVFKSTGDTETVLYAFIQLGEKIFEILNGIFAFAIFDRQTKELIIARDHFGVKPLYIYTDENKLMFSSEMKSFLNADIEKKPDYKGLFNYLTFLWSPGERTAMANVKKVYPGSYIKLNINSLHQKEIIRYAKSNFNGRYSEKSEKELIDELDMLLNTAVKRQMLSDVPVGFFLSGGLDSTLFVAMAKKQNPDLRMECFTIDVGSWSGKKEDFVNDLEYAQKAAAFLDADLNIVKANINIVEDFDRMIWHLDEPQADAAPLNVLKIAQLAREKNIKVLIGGTGGDDIFSGYRRHQALKIEGLAEKVPVIFRKLFKLVVGLLPSNSAKVNRLRKVAKYIDADQETRLKGYFQWLSTQEVFALFSSKNKVNLQNYDPTSFFDNCSKEIPLEKSLLNKMLFWELNSFLVDHNLNYTDKMGMAVGVEIRVPYLDLDVVSFSQDLPPDLKLKDNETKYILKKVAERYLPHEIIYRPKTGFGAPVRQWITHDLSSMIENRLSPERLRKRGIFDADKVWELINANKAGKIDASYSIWALLAIESWLTQFVDE
jgi:asparagine synthase (glutamine-hydrolysing)